MRICVHSIHWFKVEENMMRMKETKILSALQTEIHALQWRIWHSRGMSGLESYINHESQLVKIGLIQIKEPHSGLDCRYQLCQNFNHKPGNTWLRKLHLSLKYQRHISVSDTLECRPELWPNFDDMRAKAATLQQMSEHVSDIWTEVLNIA